MEENMQLDPGTGVQEVPVEIQENPVTVTNREYPMYEFVTGPAGTGKTYELRKRIQEQDGYGVLAATTGIAAVNLGEGVTTIHSLLRFFNEESLKEKRDEGGLVSRLLALHRDEDVRRIIIDECSMLSKGILQMIWEGTKELEDLHDRQMGLVLTGDFCQLPPVQKDRSQPVPYCFDAECWEQSYAGATTRLSKVWRQREPLMLEALHRAREAKGEQAVQALVGAGVKFSLFREENFQGTTIVATNAEAEGYNEKRLKELGGEPVTFCSRRWGGEDAMKEWKEIPQQVVVKPEALVMVLVNDTENWEFVNGTLGHYLGTQGTGEWKGYRIRKLNGEEVVVPTCVREKIQKTAPDEWKDKPKTEWPLDPKKAIYIPKYNGCPYYVPEAPFEKAHWVVGEVTFTPLRLAWALTCHKTQGLSLDSVQIDPRHWFFSSPQMAYVALSRCTTAGGLRIVGKPSQLAKAIRIDPRVKQWL